MIEASMHISEISAIMLEATTLLESGKINDALIACNTGVDLYPESAKLHAQKGFTLAKLKQFESALISYNQALELDASDAETLFRRANTYKALKQYTLAISDYEAVIQTDDKHAKAWFNLGVVYQLCQNADAALMSYKRATSINHQYPEAHNNLGNLLKNLNRLEEAIACYGTAISQKPMAEIYYNQANALAKLGRTNEAITAYEQAILQQPQYATAYNNLGVLYLSNNRYEEAINACQQAISIDKHYAEAHNNLGNIFKQMHQHSQALNHYQQAIRLNAHYADAYNNAGLLLQTEHRLEDALAYFTRAIDLNKNYAESFYNRSNVHRDCRDLTRALDDIKKAALIDPNNINYISTLLYTKMLACEWDGLAQIFVALEALIMSGGAVGPFVLLATPASANMQKICAQNYAVKKNKAPAIESGIQKQAQHARIKIGYFSADLHNHATTYLMAELFEKHDKSQFELIAFSFGTSREDEMKARVKKAFDQFYDVRTYTEAQIAKLARALEIDIAIDLKGYTKEARPSIFSHRPAPIQVNYLGYPGTMGADYIDYLIADPTIIPEHAQSAYTEKIAYLPHSYQVNDRHRKIASVTNNRAQYGLPNDAFVFCCFNNNYKITPDIFSVWMQILHKVNNSVLWLFEANATATHNLISAAKQHGISNDRMIFAPKKPMAEHLARYQFADLVLDTLHYNGHTTTSDALWAGAPVLTCLGNTFAGRVAASLLNAHDVPELITPDLETYQELAIKLASNPAKLAEIKEKVQKNRETHPLFDTERYTKNLEALYLQMYKRYQKRLPTDYLTINTDA